MKRQRGWICVGFCLLVAGVLFVSLRGLRHGRVEADEPPFDSGPLVIEAEDCLAGSVPGCATEGGWQPWELEGASGGTLIHNEVPGRPGVGASATLALEFQGLGLGVVYLQDWYGKLGVQINDHHKRCISQAGPARAHQSEVYFALSDEPLHTLALSAVEPTGTITGVVTVDALHTYLWTVDCPPRDPDCHYGMLVPAYIDPTTVEGAAYWDLLVEASEKLEERLIAIANPMNGPGDSAIDAYGAYIETIAGHGSKVIGYVYTGFAGRSIDLIQEDVDRWYDDYPTISGIFFDEVSTEGAKVDDYQALYDDVQAQQPDRPATVVLNFGTTPDPSYLSIDSALLCTFEGPFTRFAGWSPPDCAEGWTRPEWLPPERSCVLVYDTMEGELEEGLSHLVETGARWFYFSDDTLEALNPWDTLPPYFPIVVDEVRWCHRYLPFIPHPWRRMRQVG